jgi:hypothetical protein
MIQREEIEKIRHELHALGSERGLNDSLVLQKSQLLDAMLNQFMQRSRLKGKSGSVYCSS